MVNNAITEISQYYSASTGTLATQQGRQSIFDYTQLKVLSVCVKILKAEKFEHKWIQTDRYP
jgi:hypothetical protein